ncbi:MAG: protein phosphatase CheZ [Xanthobacteraceae bacterium]
MPVKRKIYRIEQISPIAGVSAALSTGKIPAAQQQEILTELKALHDLLERRTLTGDAETSDAGGLRRLKDETDAIHQMLSRTKHEIASLHLAAFDGKGPARVTRELDAVAESAERATQLILGAAEDIEDAANNLSASLKREQEQALALDIQDHVLRIFEACNFQDLSGQRITKVLATLKFVEERIAQMMHVWDDIDALKREAVVAPAERAAASMLHGPQLDDDRGHVTQDEVDRIFAAG